MATQFLEFHGHKDEDAEEFMEKMEFACLLADKQDHAVMLRILFFSLKGEARIWLKDYQAQLKPPRVMAYDEVKRAFIDHFRKVEDPDKLWHTIQGLVQGEEQDVDAFLKQFNELWERWCVALDEEAPPTMLKKEKFLSSLKSSLRWKVELKQPHSFEEAVEMAKNKEWKIKRLIQLGIKEKSEVEVKIVSQPKVLVRETNPWT